MNIIIFISNHKTTRLLAVREIKGHKEGWKLGMEAEVEIVQILIREKFLELKLGSVLNQHTPAPRTPSEQEKKQACSCFATPWQ